jgi:hypothetical protein
MSEQNGCEPTVVQFQSGFQWPHFALTHDVLCELDLTTTANEADICVKLYNSSLRTWTKVHPGFVIAVKEGEQVFLKALHVTDCTDFDRLINNTLKEPLHNICTDLKQECSYVCKRLHSATSLGSSSSSSSISSLATTLPVLQPTYESSNGEMVATIPVTPVTLVTPITPITPVSPIIVVKTEAIDKMTDEEDIIIYPLLSQPRPAKHKVEASPVIADAIVSPEMSPALVKTSEDPIVIEADMPIWLADFYVTLPLA